MATIDIRDAAGKKAGTRDLPPEIFDAEVRVPLMHQVVVAGLAGIRSGTHSTKTRGEVRGGGRKPWRQKGTGRSRQGSIRSPQWAGGGVAHGPTPRDHAQRINKKMRRGALRSALTDAQRSGKLAVVEDLAWDEPKTKQAAGLLEALELAGRVLLVLAAPSDSGAVEKSFRNIPTVKIAYASGLGTYDVLLADRVLLTTSAIDRLGQGSGAEMTPEPDKASAKAPAKRRAKSEEAKG
jgi:large subunit ribosomal protein L4